MRTKFYRAFEEKFRGTRQEIYERLKVYIPFIENLQGIYDEAHAIDLGCGRGEWLELLAENGFSAQGVDLDESMLRDCYEQGLSVIKGDAIECIRSLDDNSQVIVSAFHVVEHLPFDSLHILVAESLRVLKPGGLLIIETPNPENLMVGSSNFYLDPTHIKPLPAQLMAFMPRYYGFGKVKVLRLNETIEQIESMKLSLIDVLTGVSPDYSVIAQKKADPNILNLTDPAFEIEYGLSIEQLAENYHQQVKKIEGQSRQLENEMNTESLRIGELENEISTLKDNWQLRNDQLEQELSDVYRSKAWLLTMTLRKLAHCLKYLLRQSLNIINMSVRRFKQTIANLLAKIVQYVLRHPKMRSKLIMDINRYPQIKIKVKTFLNNKGLNYLLYSSIGNQEVKTNCNNGGDGRGHNDEKDGYGNEFVSDEIPPKGLNQEQKSPLEKWFN